MIVQGIGVDIIEIQRIENSIKEFGNIFLNKIFTAKEIEYCQSKKNSAQHFAARFAAKEAVSKAIGSGWTNNFQWKHIEVLNNDSGLPTIILHDKLLDSFQEFTFLLSLSHSEISAVAFVVMQKK